MTNDLTNRWLPREYSMVISNDTFLQPRPPRAEPFLYNWEGAFIGWEKGYEFRQFLGNCYALLGQQLSELSGIQQLIHHYYLQNGSLSARDAVQRIKKFIGNSSEYSVDK